MPFFKDGYQTTVGSMFETRSIETAIKEALIKGSLSGATLGVAPEGDTTLVFITGASPDEAQIPLFTHPISIFNFQHKNYLVCDMRLYLRKDVEGSAVGTDSIDSFIKNRTEFNFNKSRAILNLAWLAGGSGEIRNTFQFAGIVYAAWLSGLISRAYALDFKDQLVASIVISAFYQLLFTESDTLSEDDKQRLAVHTIKATNAPSKLVFEVFDKLSPMKNIEDLCTNIVEVLENVRLKKFNVAMLLTLVKYSWYGCNGKEIISVALEHPPTWNAMVYTALNERTFKTSIIYMTAEKFGKRGAADGYIASYNNLIKGRVRHATESANDIQLVFKDFE